MNYTNVKSYFIAVASKIYVLNEKKKCVVIFLDPHQSENEDADTNVNPHEAWPNGHWMISFKLDHLVFESKAVSIVRFKQIHTNICQTTIDVNQPI